MEWICGRFVLGYPWLHTRRVLPLSMALPFAPGIASDRPRVQEALVVGFPVLLTTVAFVFSSSDAFGIAP